MKRIFIFLTFLLIVTTQDTYSQLTFSANPEYGQIYDVIFDTKTEGTLYARTVGNHIVKSEDDGANWGILYSDPMVQYSTLSSLKLLNNDQNLSFIVKAEGTDYSKVVIISIIDGAVVKEYNVPNPQQEDVLIASYSIYEADNDTALLHTTYTENFGFTNEVFKTTDGGTSWRSIYYGPDYRGVAINNVAIFPDDPNTFFLMRGVSPGSDMGGVFLSHDGGSTWEEKIPGNTYSAIEFNPRNSNDILVGTFYGFGSHRENVYRSLDGGDTWNMLPITYTTMANDNINHIKFNPQNTDNIIILEENEIISTTDNGATWNNHVYTEINPDEYYFGLTTSFNPFVADDVIISSNFYPFRSSDGGRTLEKVPNRFVNSTGRIDGFFSETENHLYYGVRNGFIHNDFNNNTETPYRTRPLNNTFGATTFPYADKEVVGRIFNSARFGMNSVLEMSTDHGATYNSILSSMMFLNIYAMATAPSNTDLVWFSFGEGAYKINVADPLMPIVEQITLPTTDLMYGIIIDPADPLRVTITQGTKVYISTDGGLSWEDSSTGLEILSGRDMILDAKINPLNANEYILASTQGVFLSEDKGETWSQIFDEHIDSVNFSDLKPGQIVAINHFSDGFLYPAADARIVYSKDNGANWEIIDGATLEYINTGSSTVHFFEDKADVYFGTFDVGLVKYTLDLFTLGTSNFESENEVVLFPNPSSTYISLESKNATIQSVAIYTLTGQLVLETTKSVGPIALSHLNSGVHLVKIVTDNGTYNKRLLKL